MQRFIDWIDECLGVEEIDQQLTNEGRGWIAQIFNELLDNAERYSNNIHNLSNWAMTGFMAKRTIDQSETFFMNISVLSSGNSIADTIGRVSGADLERLRRYQGVGGANRDCMSTIFAIQDYITADPNAAAGQRGGLGFQSIVEFMNELGGSYQVSRQPRLTIISGSACIHIAAPYINREKRDRPSGPREIWFNARNSEREPPDRSSVVDLPMSLNGTLVTLQFYLDPEYLHDTV